MSVYAFSDIHGNGAIWDKIKAFLKEDDKVYFLGDAIDRGPDGYRIMKEMLADPRITYLKGNHEYMMDNALYHYQLFGKIDGQEMRLWDMNGCFPTFDAWKEAGKDFSIIDTLHDLPLEAEYTSPLGFTFLMSHAGYTPGDRPPLNETFLWDRDHMMQDIENIELVNPMIRILHGHSPAPYYAPIIQKHMKNNGFFHSDFECDLINNIMVYGNRRLKIDIDCWTIHTNSITLLDLDTLETYVFEGDKII